MPHLTHRRMTPQLHRCLFREKTQQKRNPLPASRGLHRAEEPQSQRQHSPVQRNMCPPLRCRWRYEQSGASSLTAPSPMPQAATVLAGRFRRRLTCQQGLLPGKAGQRRRRFQSRRQSYLKPSQPPQLTGLCTLRASPGPPATLMKAWGAPGTSAAGQALRSGTGVLLADARSPQGRSRQRNLPATTVDRSWMELSHSPGPTLLSKSVLHAGLRPSPNAEHAPVHKTPHLHPPSNSRATPAESVLVQEKVTSLSSSLSSSRHNRGPSPSPPSTRR